MDGSKVAPALADWVSNTEVAVSSAVAERAGVEVGLCDCESKWHVARQRDTLGNEESGRMDGVERARSRVRGTRNTGTVHRAC